MRPKTEKQQIQPKKCSVPIADGRPPMALNARGFALPIVIIRGLTPPDLLQVFEANARINSLQHQIREEIAQN
jgi:hypothetical protein